MGVVATRALSLKEGVVTSSMGFGHRDRRNNRAVGGTMSMGLAGARGSRGLKGSVVTPTSGAHASTLCRTGTSLTTPLRDAAATETSV